MNHSLFRTARFWIPALVAAAAIALVAFSVGRGSPAGGTADGPGSAGGLPPMPRQFPPPGKEVQTAAAIDELLVRGSRQLEEENLAEAAGTFERAMKDARAAGESVYLVRATLGRTEALARQGKETEALELAAAMRRERPADPPIIEALRLAALESALFLGLGRPMEAAPVAREALDDADRHYNGDTKLRGLILTALVDALAATEGFTEAARAVDEHLERAEIASRLGPGDRADWLDRAGRLWGAADDFAKSAARLEASLDARVAAGGDDPVPAAITRISLAASLFDAGQPDRARDEAIKAHAVLSEKLPPDDPERRRLSEIAARIGAELEGP